MTNPIKRTRTPEYLMLRGVIADMPDEDRQKVMTAVDDIVAIVDAGGDHALVALALVAIEKQED